MKTKEYIQKFVMNKYVLYIVSALAILNVIGLLVANDYRSVLLFILFALFIYQFSKNMVYVLGIPLVFIQLVQLKGREGMETKTKDSKDTKTKTKIKREKELATLPEYNDTTPNETDTEVEETFEVGNKKGGYKIDYASTIENAYQDLNKMIGSEGMKSLTADTQRLVKQQAQLTESMKSMEPFIKNMAPMLKQAQDMMNNMNSSEGLTNIMNMAKKMTSGV